MEGKNATLKQIHCDLEVCIKELTRLEKIIPSVLFPYAGIPIDLFFYATSDEIHATIDIISSITKTHDQVHDLVYMLKTNKSILEQDIRDYGDNITWIDLVRKKVGKRISEALNAATDSTR